MKVFVSFLQSLHDAHIHVHTHTHTHTHWDWNFKIFVSLCMLPFENPLCWASFFRNFSEGHGCFPQIYQAALKADQNTYCHLHFCVMEMFY